MAHVGIGTHFCYRVLRRKGLIVQMSSVEIRAIADAVDRFIRDSSNLNAKEAEERLLPILSDLLDKDGFDLVKNIRPEPTATDYIAYKRSGSGQTYKLGVEYKHYEPERLVDEVAIEQMLTAAQRNQLERIMLIARPGFTKGALEAAQRNHPLELQLLDYNGLRGWVLRVEKAEIGGHSRIIAMITELSREAAWTIAADPRELENLEWRDLERMIAVVLERLGFKAELTPGSKDKGKDVILTLEDNGVVRTYIVELKHWRSGQQVGKGKVKEFVQVVAKEGREGGLFLATYGYTEDASSALTEVERSKVKFGIDQKIVSLCRTYVKAESGLWSLALSKLSDVLFEETQ